MTRRTEALLLFAVLGLGAMLRLLYLGELEQRIDFRHPAVDAGYNDYWARALATGDWTPRTLTYDPEIGRWPFFRPPGYPYALSAVYRSAGVGFLAPRVAQMLLGLGSAFLLYLLGRRLFGPAVGLVAALLVSTSWVLIHFEGELLDAALFLFLNLALLLLLVRFAGGGGPALALAAGLTAGLAAVVRPTILSFVPFALVWLYRQVRHRDGPRRGVAAGLSLLGGAAVAILPVTARNYAVSGEFVPISTNAGVNLLIGNNEKATGTGGSIRIDGVPFTNSDELPRCLRASAQIRGRPVGAGELSRELGLTALRYMRENPARTLWLMGRKALLFWGPAELGHQRELTLDREASRTLSRLPLGFPEFTALGFAGLALLLAAHRPGWRRVAADEGESAPRAAVGLLLLFVAVTFGSLLVFFITSQYRLPVLPVLALLAAYGLVEVCAALRSRRGRALLWAAVLAAAYGLACVNWAGVEPQRERWHFDQATLWEKEGQPARAEEEYRKALEIDPAYNDALINVGVLCARQGRFEEAEAYFRRSLRVSQTAVAHVNLGRLMGLRGRTDEALRQYEEALRLNPMYEIAHNNLGVLLMEDGQLAAAERHFRTAAEIRPNWPEAWRNLARCLELQGRGDEARRLLPDANPAR